MNIYITRFGHSLQITGVSREKWQNWRGAGDRCEIRETPGENGSVDRYAMQVTWKMIQRLVERPSWEMNKSFVSSSNLTEPMEVTWKKIQRLEPEDRVGKWKNNFCLLGRAYATVSMRGHEKMYVSLFERTRYSRDLVRIRSKWTNRSRKTHHYRSHSYGLSVITIVIT